MIHAALKTLWLYRARSSEAVSANSAGQRLKTPTPICATEAGMATETSDEQFVKAKSPIFMTEAGMATETGAKQLAKTFSPICVMDHSCKF